MLQTGKLNIKTRKVGKSDLIIGLNASTTYGSVGHGAITVLIDASSFPVDTYKMALAIIEEMKA